MANMRKKIKMKDRHGGLVYNLWLIYEFDDYLNLPINPTRLSFYSIAMPTFAYLL